MSVLDQAAVLVALAGVVCVAAATLRGGRWRVGLGQAVDLWLAASLLRLGSDRSWDGIAAAAVLVAVRVLVGVGPRAGWTHRPPGRLA